MNAITTSEAGTAVEASAQSRALLALVDNFMETLKLTESQSAVTVFKVVDRIGAALHDRFWGPFTPDPVLHFIVDEVSSDVEDALWAAINVGALIELDNSEGYGSGLGGRRFRLTYLLAPRYALPIALGRPVPLGELLH
jgi:hypothetical protein